VAHPFLYSVLSGLNIRSDSGMITPVVLTEQYKYSRGFFMEVGVGAISGPSDFALMREVSVRARPAAEADFSGPALFSRTKSPASPC
jgi:hypothetical protein